MAPKAISEKSNAPPADNVESAPGSCAGEAALPRVGVVVNELSVDELVDDVVINALSVDIGVDELFDEVSFNVVVSELSVDVVVNELSVNVGIDELSVDVVVPSGGGSVIKVPP